MKEILEKEYMRKPFLIMVFSLLVIFSILRYCIIPSFDSSFSSGWLSFGAGLLDGLISTVFVTTGLALTVYYISPDVMKKSNIRIVEPRALSKLFDNALKESEIWWYKGGCGRYFRTQTLPMMANSSRESSQTKEVRVSILDPFNGLAVEKHALFRRSTASGSSESEEWTAERVKCELFATIITTLLYQIEAPSLRISLHLVASYSAFRIDLSDKYVIITKEDKFAPAILCDVGTYFYKSYKDEVVLSESQARKVDLLFNGDYNRNNFTSEKVKEILSKVGLWRDCCLSNEEMSRIASLIKNPVNPYG